MTDAGQVKVDLQRLMNQRGVIEQEIAEITERLNAPNMPGLNGPLTDSQGFPRSDVDVAAVRTDRNRVIHLTNDHKQISKHIDQLLQKLHAMSRPQNQIEQSKRSAVLETPQPAAAFKPYAVVNEVASGSPAEEAGLQPGDQWVQCGNVTVDTVGGLKATADFLKAHKDQAVDLVVLRAGIKQQLSFCPHEWSGPGLLGCHLLPVP